MILEPYKDSSSADGHLSKNGVNGYSETYGQELQSPRKRLFVFTANDKTSLKRLMENTGEYSWESAAFAKKETRALQYDVLCTHADWLLQQLICKMPSSPTKIN